MKKRLRADNDACLTIPADRSSKSECRYFGLVAFRPTAVAIVVTIMVWLSAAWPFKAQAANHDIELLYQTGDVVDGVELGGYSGDPGNFFGGSLNDSGNILWAGDVKDSNDYMFFNDRVVLGQTRPLNIGGVRHSSPLFFAGSGAAFTSANEWIIAANSEIGDAIVTSNGEVLARRPGMLHGRSLVNFSLSVVGVDTNDVGDIVLGAAFPEGESRNQFISLNGEIIAKGGDQIDDRTLRYDVWPHGATYPRINNNGDVLYFAPTERGGSLFMNDRVLYEPGQAVGALVVEDIGPFQHRLNNVGDVAWVGKLHDPNVGDEAFWALLINDEVVVRSGSLFDGEAIAFPAFDVSLNDHGQFLFRAELDDGRNALFTNAGLVAKGGDLINGFLVPEDPWLVTGPSSLNSAGDFVFSINDWDQILPGALFHGRIPIPVPEPTTGIILLIGMTAMLTRLRPLVAKPAG